MSLHLLEGGRDGGTMAGIRRLIAALTCQVLAGIIHVLPKREREILALNDHCPPPPTHNRLIAALTGQVFTRVIYVLPKQRCAQDWEGGEVVILV